MFNSSHTQRSNSPNPNATPNDPNGIFNTIPPSVPRNSPSDADDDASYESVTANNPSDPEPIPAPPNTSRTSGSNRSVPEAQPDPQPFQQAAAPPLELAQAIAALNRRLIEHETRSAANELEITNLRVQNQALEVDLQRARAHQAPAVPDNADDASSVSSNTNQPNVNNVSNTLLERLIAAQEESNRLNEVARIASHRARIEAMSVNIPTLRCISSDTIEDWYTRLLPTLSREKYISFYDHRAADIVPNGAFNPSLNAILFSELMPSLSPSIQDYIYAQPHLFNDGVAVIRDLKSSFDSNWTQLERDSHQHKWMQLRKGPQESFQDFFARCLRLRNVALAHDMPCTEQNLRHRFVMGLPAQFTSIQEKEDELPAKWATVSLHQLPLVAEQSLENKNNIRDMHRQHRDINRQESHYQN